MNRETQVPPLPPADTSAHVNPSTGNSDIHPFPSSKGRDSGRPAGNLTTPGLAKSLTVGAGGSPLGRIKSLSLPSEEAERLRRLGTGAKTRPVTVNTAQVNNSDSGREAKVDTELQANRAAIEELTAQVSSLTKHLAQVMKPTESVTPGDSRPPAAYPQTPTAETRGKCSDCIQQHKMSCPHCFVCGQAGHCAIGCLQRKVSGNEMRSLERGSQWPQPLRSPQHKPATLNQPAL
ncbi:hypothetical protein L3Q82_020358 [Scortum barcoo]|uniref:Uncharacterized protein n=1 Tax=Scortum barcoo TaxID=214431 RepID=A0ACB8V7H6_9TELE|nr:hypothetical protein L3Q82_020358 [Scortum barcoo]